MFISEALQKYFFLPLRCNLNYFSIDAYSKVALYSDFFILYIYIYVCVCVCAGLCGL